MGRRKHLSLLALVASALSAPVFAGCSDEVLQVRGDWGTARFTVEVVDTPQARAEGLMFRESLGRSSGMFFVYERPQAVAFWMKNTRIPLDMIFVDPTGQVQKVHQGAIPGDLTPIPGEAPDTQFVLEINGGMSGLLGLNAGSQIQHPAISQSDAAWPCAKD